MTKDNEMKFATTAIHKAQKADPVTGAVITPIYQTTTFEQEAPGEYKGYDYSRSGNPTRTVLEEVLAGMEGGAHGYAFSSGTGALTTLSLALLQPGDHIVVGDDVYGGTYRLFNKVLMHFGLKPTYVDMTDPQNVRAAITPETRMIFLETPTNPLLKLIDLEQIIAIAREHNIITAVDNTFASPYIQKPFEYGADVVLHSTTKYINGHSDVVGGALILRDDKYAEAIGFHQNAVGATPDPFASWLTLRGAKTLALRMEAHSANAQNLADFLSSHEAVEEVIYPGLETHPQYDLAKRQMKLPGGMISMRIKGSEAEVRTFLQSLQYFKLAESLGGVESLIEIPSLMTHATLTPEGREALGITDNLVRISVGIEDIEDLKADIAQAFDATAHAGNRLKTGNVA